MSKTFINPAALSKPTGYTHVVDTRGSRTVYISGQIAFDAQGNVVGVGDVKAQTEQVFKNIEIALTSVGAKMSDIVKVTYFILDISQLPTVREIRARYFDANNPPASSAFEVRGLAHPDLLIEIEAIAVLE
jgi:reactive intermediate/imine deaminase